MRELGVRDMGKKLGVILFGEVGVVWSGYFFLMTSLLIMGNVG